MIRHKQFQIWGRREEVIERIVVAAAFQFPSSHPPSSPYILLR